MAGHCYYCTGFTIVVCWPQRHLTYLGWVWSPVIKLLMLWLWEIYLNAYCLSILTYKIEMIMVPVTGLIKINEILHISALKNIWHKNKIQVIFKNILHLVIEFTITTSSSEHFLSEDLTQVFVLAVLLRETE